LEKQYLSKARIALSQPEPDDADGMSQSSWAERQTEYAGIDPLVCPNCDQPLMFVGTFFGNRDELQSLFDKAGKNADIPCALLRPG